MAGRRLLFASYHCYLDPSSGAALSARDLLELLAGRGWDCRVFCGPRLDFERPESLAQLISDQQVPFHQRRPPAAAGFSMLHFTLGGVPCSIYSPGRVPNRGLSRFSRSENGTVPLVPPHSLPTPDVHPGTVALAPRTVHPSTEEGTPFLELFERVLRQFRPHAVLTYGGHWLGAEMMRRCRRLGAKVVFWLRNFAYNDPRLFSLVDGVLVPSQFSADHYRRQLGLACTAIPSPLGWDHVRSEPAPGRKYVTFVNPQPAKGVFVFARIAHELARRRPDIPLLVVEGRGTVDWLARTGVDFRGVESLHRMPNTPDPRHFYAVSRLVLMPSLWWESFGRVAAEAMLNGIPVLASSRGSLPEVLGDAGFLFDIPDRYTPQTRLVPTADEVAPWVETAIRLWDDDAFYDEASRRSLRAADLWRPERLAVQYEAFFETIAENSACGVGT